MEVPFLDLRAQSGALAAELDAAALRVVRSGWYVLGPEVEAFERAWADACGTRFAAGVGNGLDALTLALRAGGVGPGDEVVVTSTTYIATWLAVSAVGATIVAVEPDPATHRVDPALVAPVLTARTRAVLVTHLHGRLACDRELRAWCDERSLLLVEDAAQAHGAALPDGTRAGAIGHVAGFSFYPSKNLGALGDGGAVTTSDPELDDAVRVLRNYGSRVRYENEVAGVNSRLDPVQAAFLAVKLPWLDGWNARRRAIAARYLAALEGRDDVVAPSPGGLDHVWHLFVVRAARRDALAAELAAAGVGTQVHYPVAPHRSGAYAHLGHVCPVADRHAAEVLSLPLHPQLSDRQVALVCAALHRGGQSQHPNSPLTAQPPVQKLALTP